MIINKFWRTHGAKGDLPSDECARFSKLWQQGHTWRAPWGKEVDEHTRTATAVTKNYNNHNLSQLNLQIFHDLLQTKRYFHLRISGKSSPVKVSIVWAWLASLEDANCMMFFPFLRKCQRRKNTPCKCGDLLKSRLSIVDLQRMNITDHNNQAGVSIFFSPKNGFFF